MQIKITDQTTLEVEQLGCSRREAMRREGGEFEALYKATNKTTGVTGHLLYYIAWEGRDVDTESLHTDNSDLIVGKIDMSPSAWFDSTLPDSGVDTTTSEVASRCDYLVYGEE